MKLKAIQIKRIVSVLLCGLLVLCALPASAAEEEGLRLSDTDRYQMTAAFGKKMPLTYEATVKMDKNPSNPFFLFSNWEDVFEDSVSIYFEKDGRMVFMIGKKEGGPETKVIFDKTKLTADVWTHVAVVLQPKKSLVSYYINGELVQSLSCEIPDLELTRKMQIGSELNSDNAYFFHGLIRDAALYEDQRTPEEIKADSSGNYGTAGMLAGYDLTDGDCEEFQDLSKNKNTLKRVGMEAFFSDKAAAKNYAYSFCVIGDTQKIARYHPDMVDGLYDWVEDNLQSKKIKSVLHMGDITDLSYQYEYKNALENFRRIKDKTELVITRGNHDSTETFTSWFTYEEFGKYVDGAYEQNMINVWREFKVGDTQYLVITLDYGPSDEVLAWANQVVAAHPKHKVIVTTHAYVYLDGKPSTPASSTAPKNHQGNNNGEDVWNKFVKKHNNIFLVLSGHHSCDRVEVDQAKGDHGNVVTQMLIDFQGVDDYYDGTGMVTMLYFGKDGNTLEVETYSTAKKMYYLKENQFKVDLQLETLHQTTTSKPNITTVPDIDLPDDENETPVSSDSPTINPDALDKQPEENGLMMLYIGVAVGVVVLIAAVAVVMILRKKKKKS